MVHPHNKAERLLNEQRKERARLRKEERASRVRAKLIREELKEQETQDELRQESGLRQ